jgi:predicted Fe-Mo cluster-binding NifX family protein
VIVDPATDEHHYLLVDPPAPGHRVCLETIRALVGERVGLVVLPHITPPCCQALWSLAIDVVLVPAEGTVREVIARYKSGQLGEAQVLWPKEEDSV